MTVHFDNPYMDVFSCLMGICFRGNEFTLNKIILNFNNLKESNSENFEKKEKCL